MMSLVGLAISIMMAAVSLVLLYSSDRPGDRSLKKGSKVSEQVPRRSLIETEEEAEELSLQINDAKGLQIVRDPFVSIAQAPTSKAKVAMVLNGILWDDQNPTAMINGQILAVGDSVQGKKVVEIQKNKVILSDGSATTELLLGN